MIEIGIVGKPNAGKSSFFRAATLLEVKISNIPFTTIEPNIGISFVSFNCVCKEFGVKCNPKDGFCVNGKRFVPIKLIDVAGLVPEAHKGKGLGNKFLDDLRKAEVLIHVVDFSGLTDERGNPTTNHNPLKDIEFLEKEIELWFEKIVSSNLKKIDASKNLVDEVHRVLSGLEISKEAIKKALEKTSIYNTKEFSHWLRVYGKPIIIAANKIDLEVSQKNFERLKNALKDRVVIPVSAEAEIALKLAAKNKLINYVPGNGFEIIGKLNEKQEIALKRIKKIIEKYGSTGVQKVLNKAVFEIANYIPVYPVADVSNLSDKEGNVLPNVFLVKKGTTLKEFASLIHSEIAEKFICGIDVRTKKKLAANYELKARDVIKIMFKK